MFIEVYQALLDFRYTRALIRHWSRRGQRRFVAKEIEDWTRNQRKRKSTENR